MDRSQVAIIIPAYNEEKTIGKVVHDVFSYGIPIVANDASTDRTAEIAQRAGAVVVSHSRNMGYDGALNTAFAKADELSCTYAITFDADGQHSSGAIGHYINALEMGSFLVCGIRPCRARFAENVFAYVTTVCFGLKDPLCGMKGYRMKAYREKGCFDSCHSIGTELPLTVIKRGLKFSQFPIQITERADNPRFGNIFRANFRIATALIRVLLHIYYPGKNKT